CCCGCGRGETERLLRRDHGLLFPGRCGHSGSGCSSGSRANRGAFAAAGDASDERTHDSSATDLGGVAFGMTLTLNVVAAGGEREGLASDLHGGEPNGELPGGVEASAGLGSGYLAASE